MGYADKILLVCLINSNKLEWNQGSHKVRLFSIGGLVVLHQNTYCVCTLSFFMQSDIHTFEYPRRMVLCKHNRNSRIINNIISLSGTKAPS